MATKPETPFKSEQLEQIVRGACNDALGSAESYVHSSCEEWNKKIINDILAGLIRASEGLPTTYKFAVNSTIIQSATEPKPKAETEVETGTEEKKPHAGRRGMHSSTGAYWDNTLDGMWSYKYEAAESKGMDVVISLIWVAR